MRTFSSATRLWLIVVVCALLGACKKDKEESESATTPPTPPPVGGNSPPTIGGQPNAEAVAGQMYEFRPSASDPDGDRLTYSVQNKPAWAAFNTTSGRLRGTPTAGDAGAYSNILIRVSDGAASASMPGFAVNVVVQAGNSPPTISGQPSSEVVVGAAYDFRPSASDPDGDSLTYSVQNKPGWANFNGTSGRLSGTPTAGNVGSYSNILIRVSDGAASASLPGFAVNVVQAGNGTASLSWVPPTTRSDGSTLVNLDGYKIHYGRASGDYSNRVTLNNPGLTAYVVDNLVSGRWFFAMTAFDATGMESNLSAEASKTIP